MLHGPWVAAMLNEYFAGGTTGGGGGGGGPHEFNLANHVDFWDSTTWDGTSLTHNPGAPTSYVDFSFADAGPLDPATTYTFEVDYTATTNGKFWVYGIKGTTAALADTSTWNDLGGSITLAGTGTLTFTIGPGLLDYDIAMSTNHRSLMFEMRNSVQVTRIAISGGSFGSGAGGGGGEATGEPRVIKAMAMKSTHTPTAGDSTRSQISAQELTGGGYTAGGVEVTNVVATWDEAGSRAVVTCDLIDFGAVTATGVGAVVFYVDNGSASADRVLWTDVFDPVAAAGALTYEPHPDGVMEIRV